MHHKHLILILTATIVMLGTAPSASPAIEQGGLTAQDIAQMAFDGTRYGRQLTDGRQVVFTVDPSLQRRAEDIFTKYKVPAGAAVVLNSRTGRVLTLAQTRKKPAFADSAEVALDPSPPAASLFKVVTAAALLDSGKTSIAAKTCYHGGSRKLLLEHLRDSPKADTACASVANALGKSINAIFAKLTDRLLVRGDLSGYAERFGFNRSLPFDIPLEPSSAQIPADRLERARTGAGFWHTHLSPLHAAMIFQALAQKGAMLRPYVVDHVLDEQGAVIYRAEPQFIGRPVGEQTAKTLVRAMVTTVRRGTARKAFHDARGTPYLPGIDVAGKTGSLTGRHPYRAYSWFVGTAPADKPEVVASVLVVNEPRWRIKASTVAMQLLKKYFNQKNR